MSGFTLTDANYVNSRFPCWNLDLERNNKSLTLIHKLWLDLPTPSKNATSLQQLYDDIESHIWGLESLAKNKDIFGDFLITTVFWKLPSVIRRNLTNDRTSEEWNIDELQSPIDYPYKLSTLSTHLTPLYTMPFMIL